MSNTSTRFLALLLAIAVFSFTACDDDDPQIENPEEVITTVTLTLTPTGSGTPVSFSFNDPDGDGATPPVTVVSGNLEANTEYTGSITFTNASDPMDIEDVTAEIREEDEEHQVFYVVTNGLNLDVAYQDQDANMNPIGLLTTLTTGAPSTGTMTVTLRHEPMKGSNAANPGDIADAGGETDIETEFDVTIE